MALPGDQLAAMFVFATPLGISLFSVFSVPYAWYLLDEFKQSCKMFSSPPTSGCWLSGSCWIVISDRLFPIGLSGNRKSCLGLPSPLLNCNNVSFGTDAV